jgi:hypothetical protein
MKYQVTIGTTARECRMGPNNMVQVKVGMQGRVILGPEGGNPGTINVPLRFAVVQENREERCVGLASNMLFCSRRQIQVPASLHVHALHQR